MLSLDNIMLTLAYLQGERQVPNSGVEGRKDFIQSTLEEVHRAYPWTYASALATLTITSSTATLPTNLDSQHKVYAYYFDGDTQKEVREINQGDSDMYQDGDIKIWLEPLSDGNFVLKTKDTNYSTIIVKYQSKAAVLASANTAFPDKMTLALGARRYIKQSQNPEADTSQDEALFQARLAENIAAQQLARPLRRARKVYHANNYRLGDG